MSLKRHKLQRVKAREKRRFVSQLSFSSIRHFHISHNAPYLPPLPHPTLPPNLHHLCFSFLLGITALPKQVENNAMGNVEVAYGKESNLRI